MGIVLNNPMLETFLFFEGIFSISRLHLCNVKNRCDTKTDSIKKASEVLLRTLRILVARTGLTPTYFIHFVSILKMR